MSKIIKLTEEVLNDIKAEFNKLLEEGKFTDGKISYSHNIKDINRKANLIFTEVAWLKMNALVREFSTEIAWHGIVHRGEEGTDDYYVTDILVYPQIVTGVTVESDKDRSFEWLTSLSDEEYSNMKMQGHSHVNMGVTPSATDLAFYKDGILSELKDDSFYIFMIMNKKGESTVKIYDYLKNVLFETSDVDIRVLNDEIGIESFIADARGKLRDKPKQTTTVASTAKTPTTVVSQTPKYKRKEKTGKKTVSLASYYSNYADYDSEDDWNQDYGYYSYYPTNYSQKGWFR